MGVGEEHGPEVLLAVEAEHERLEVLVHETVEGADVVAAEDLGEGVRVPALEQFPFLLEHVVVQLWVRRHHHRPPHDARLEDVAVPIYTSIQFVPSPTQYANAESKPFISSLLNNYLLLGLHTDDCWLTIKLVPVQSLLHEWRDVTGRIGREELQGLAEKRQAEGARRQLAVSFRVAPPVCPQDGSHGRGQGHSPQCYADQ